MTSRGGSPPPGWAIAVHGGAGGMREMGPQKEARYRQALRHAVRDGAAILDRGGAAIEACIAAVRGLEASGAVNAGRGSCLSATGQIEADAAVMVARDMSIGAVAAVPGVVNAVELAEAVRRRSPHCVIVGEGAVRFAAEHGVTVRREPPSEARLARYRRFLAARDETAALTDLAGTHDAGDTVGAVALDTAGELALAASTGGLWLKPPGRVGDSPLPGAGFWATDGVGAAVATGIGESILRELACAEAISALRLGQPLARAAGMAVERVTKRFGPEQIGLVVMSATGEIAMPFTTRGMGRASSTMANPEPRVALWADEDGGGPRQP